jgi:hypothetical protein
MRTPQEIADYYRQEQVNDFLNFTAEVLLPYLSAEQVKPFLKESADLTDWKPEPLSREGVLAAMRGYMEFAWGKVENHRGISASRSVEKMSAWLWILGDEEMVASARDNANYAYYGAPILKKICDVYGFPVPDNDGVRNMSQGKPCCEGCTEGCDK